MHRQLQLVVADGPPAYGPPIKPHRRGDSFAADRHELLAVANRDVRVARQNIAELLLYVDNHVAHLANCASADDDSLTLMSAELLPRLEGGIRAALEEVDTL